MAEARTQDEQVVRLLAWYDAHARDLPWRVRGGAKPDPYRVWLSEIMLQQTTVAAVKAYFIKFTTLWPTVADLAHASPNDVLRAWAGLGYYARARNLHACAKTVVEKHGGQFPADPAALVLLPGIGPYTAGAIAAIAFDLPYAAVDGNVERVLSRYHAIETPLPESKPLIRQLARDLVPKLRCGDFAQSLMDLGATICTPKTPSCMLCPWMTGCKGRALGAASEFPRKAPRNAIPTRRTYAFWIEREDGAILLRRRPEKGLLGGMMEVPSTPWEHRLPKDYKRHAPIAATWKKRPGIVEHTFTHFRLEVTVLRAKRPVIDDIPSTQDYRWIAQKNLSSEALPTVMRKIVAHALQ